jgi:outer membrane protein assembly factor BamE (lipoprotein component of BamABCDE complex)
VLLCSQCTAFLLVDYLMMLLVSGCTVLKCTVENVERSEEGNNIRLDQTARLGAS